MKKITALFCIVALAFASCICISAAEGLAFNDQTFMYAVEDNLPAEPVTVEVKLRIPSGATRGSFFGNYHWDETTNTIDFGIGDYGNPIIRLRDDANVYEYYFAGGTVPYNTWVHLTLVRDVANRKAYCYINGNLTQTVDMTHSYNPLANWDYKIGANNAYMNPDYFKGDVMSLAVYSDVRTESEIKRDMIAPGTSDLMISYDFSSASDRPATVADKSGNGNDAIRNRMFFDGGDVPADKYAYTFAAVGDTQNMAKSYSEHFNDIYNYIYDNIDAMNIEAVIGVGDITDTKNFGSIKSEWNVALEGLKIIDDATLSIPIIGNHDNTYWYNKTIGKLNYADLVTKYQPHDLRNAYIVREIGGIPYLFIQFEHGPSDSVLEWANEVVAAYPSHNVIVTTHGYSYHDGTTLDEGDAHNSMTNMGEAIWEKFVSKHSNIVLVLSGHVGHDYAVVNQRKGVNGNTVTEMLIDFQSCDNAAHNYGLSEYGVGVVTLFHFSADGKTVTVENYSTVLEKHFMDLNQFTLQLDTANDATYVKPDRDPLPPREEDGEDEPFVEEEPYVIYRNDFSNANTISDFTQYRAKWEIKNGGLYMTKTAIGGASSANYGNIVYNGGHELENYMIDVDFYNVCTQSGVIFRTFEEMLSHETNGFNGYYALTSNDMTLGAIGSAVNNKWVDVLLDKGAANEDMYVGVNLHFNVVVNNDMITVKMTNIDTGKLVYHGIYALGSNANDPSYVMGSFGLRMRASYSGNTAANNSYFDNLVVTSIPQKKAGPVVPVDTSDRLVVYENNFDDASALNDFAQYYGTWEVKEGRLYLTALSKTASLLVYNKDDLKNITNYVVDVDMINVQSQGGLIVRSNSEHITGTRKGNDFYGYAALIAKDGQKGALSYGMPSGDWGGNFDTSGYITYPGSNVHLQVAVLDDVITYRITAPDGMLLWEYTSQADFWTDGTFGFRLSNYTNYWGGGNVNTVSFDNLVVAELNHECTFGEWELRSLATFEEEGEYYRICPFCGTEETKTIPKLEALDVDVTLESVSVTAGDLATVTLKVKNDVAYSSFSLAVSFDKSAITLKSVSKTNLPSGFSVTSVPNANKSGKITVSYSGSSAYVGEFEITLSFSTKASFVSSSTAVTVSSSKASYTHEQGTVVDAEFNITNTELSIIGQEPPLGDTDLDGVVGISDIKTVIDAVFSGTYTEEIDFNEDGKISLVDIIFVIKESIK